MGVFVGCGNRCEARIIVSTLAYDCGELYKKTKLKIIKYGYVKGYPKAGR
jgi:hypothetical protein